MTKATWKAPRAAHHGKLDAAATKKLPDSAFAFPKKRKEPMMDASHVRNALARFNQVEDVTEAEKDLAFANIKKAAKHFDIEMNEESRHELAHSK